MRDGFIPGKPINNWAGVGSPAPTNDSSADYEEGSLWVDTRSERVYVCTDASVGRARWREMTLPDVILRLQSQLEDFNRLLTLLLLDLSEQGWRFRQAALVEALERMPR